jgi:hypothetical protein
MLYCELFYKHIVYIYLHAVKTNENCSEMEKNI